MKTLITLITLALLLNASSAHAELAWAKTKFWATPYNSEISIVLKPNQSLLTETCNEYSQIVTDGVGNKTMSAEELDILRRNSADASQADFSVEFKVAENDSSALINNSIAEANSAALKQTVESRLPFSQQTTAAISLEVGSKPKLNFKHSQNSLLGMSESLGLKMLAIKVLPNGLNSSFIVAGKDLVCDLIQGHANLEFQAQASVKIKLESQLAGDDFYKKIEDITATTLPKRKTIIGKASILGLALGNEISQSLKVGTEQTEVWLGNLIETFFDENMNRSNGWTYLGETPHLMMPGGSDPVVVTVKAKVNL